MASIFFSYSHKDESLRNELETHLAMLKHEGLITSWHDRKILAGDEFGGAIDTNLKTSEIILLLVSPDFLASRYCYDIEVKQAMTRHAEGTARVIPVILRFCDWTHAPFGKLLAAPRDGKPVTKWPDKDEAFLDVARQIREALPKAPSTHRPQTIQPRSVEAAAHPRSSNLRIRQSFTEADQDRFLNDAFDFIAKYFDASLEELKTRNSGIETRYCRSDPHSFTAVIYQQGKKKSACSVHLGGRSGSRITYSNDESSRGNSFNEALSVEIGEQSLSIKPLVSDPFRNYEGKGHLTLEGGAEYFWSMLIEPLQR